MQLLRLSAVFILISICLSASDALKCRSDDGHSDDVFKRVARSCMRKVGENSDRYDQNQSGSSYRNGDWDYDQYNRDDRLRSGNRDRSQMRTRRLKRSSNDRRYDSASSGGRNPNQRSSGNNHYGSSSGNNHNNYNSSYGDRQSGGIQQAHPGACVAHCFFDEMNMLNGNEYPDRHKLIYILTKDIRDAELRAFYTDTIQECFHYLEMQQRKDKCQFSKELISCMMEYARANCEDWQNHNLVFS